MARAVFCIAVSQQHAEMIIENLKKAGFSPEDISVLFTDKSGAQTFAHESQTKLPEGAAAGAGTGLVVGAGLGWLAGIGTLAIPGLGPLLAAGPILGALSGAGAGATVGGLAGALIGLGIAEYVAKRFEGELKEGSILVSVHTGDREETRRAKAIVEAAGAKNVATTREAAVK